MMIRKFVSIALCAVLGYGLGGCVSTSADQEAAGSIENVSVTLAPGRTLASAITAAASQRRWLPQAQADGTMRCTLSQREHLVIVDVVPNGEGAFSIRLVQSNIPVRKYNQWANNLKREIVYQAAR